MFISFLMVENNTKLIKIKTFSGLFDKCHGSHYIGKIHLKTEKHSIKVENQKKTFLFICIQLWNSCFLWSLNFFICFPFPNFFPGLRASGLPFFEIKNYFEWPKTSLSAYRLVWVYLKSSTKKLLLSAQLSSN